MEQVRILATDSFEKEGVEILKSAGFDVVEMPTQPPDKLAEIIGDFDVLIVRSATKATADVIRRGSRLKIVGRAGVGLDNIDIKEATAGGVIVMNAPEGNTTSAAELTIGMLLGLARNIPQADASLKSGQWERKKFMGTELYGKTLGVIGLGRIGRRVASVAKALGMKVLGYDPFVAGDGMKNSDIGLVGLEGLCKQADFITLHIPLTDATKHLLGEKQFALMKDGVRIVNCARGGVVDEQALAAAVQSKKAAGAALDVFEKEPPGDNPLLGLEQVIATPHLGASTKEAQVNVAHDLAVQIVDAFTKKVVKNAVNLPSLDEPAMEKIGGYLPLGEKLGVLLAQMTGGVMTEAVIEYAGEITNYDLSLLRSHVLKGLLAGQEKANIVNAHLLLKEKGVTVKEKRSAGAGEFANLITVEVKGERKISAAGTLNQQQEARIVKIDNFDVEAAARGVLLVCYNEDKPGIMGHIGNVLGAKGVNIASMTLGRKKKGGPAITVLNLDEGIDETVLKNIEEFPAIQTVRLVRL